MRLNAIGAIWCASYFCLDDFLKSVHLLLLNFNRKHFLLISLNKNFTSHPTPHESNFNRKSKKIYFAYFKMLNQSLYFLMTVCFSFSSSLHIKIDEHCKEMSQHFLRSKKELKLNSVQFTKLPWCWFHFLDLFQTIMWGNSIKEI